MASKFGFAGGIPERRVRPIWDAVDSRQFKNALKLSASLLSKYPNSPYALALKALILERMGKNDEALSVCLTAKQILCSDDPTVFVDDLTLSTLQIVFQRLDHLDMATSCYEHAGAKYPNNLELMVGLFNCYVREYSFVKQQQIAIKMYKIAGEERFLLWAVCSIQLQVCCGSGEEKLLLLAEGLLKKHIASHGLHEPEALSVYISLLEQQHKYGDALEILSGKLGSLMMIEADKLRLQGRLLARAGDYSAAADVFQKIIELCPDDWECFLQYLGCLLQDENSFINENDTIHPLQSSECSNLHLSEELFDSQMSNAVDFIQKLLAGENNDSVRCPYLALLEIERRKLLFGKGDAEKLVDGLLQYFVRFGHLACFATDVEMFIQVLENNKKSDILTKIYKECESSMSMPAKALGRSINVFKTKISFGDVFTLPVEDLEDLAVQMTELFCKNLPLSKQLDVQESMYGEDLLSMASTVLVQLFWRTRNLGYLLESIMVLEFGLAIRRYVWQYKILLVHLYSYWNALPLAYERYKSLDVKNILFETVSHHILPQMLASPLWTDLNNLLREYLKFMDDHFRESADHTFLAYRHRNYSKVIEFVQFKERLQRSNQYLMAKIEAPILQLKQNSNNIVEEETIMENLSCGIHFIELSNEIKNKSLTFNEDLEFRPWWTPTYDKNYLLGPFEGVSYCPRENKHRQTKKMEANILKTIEKRSLLPRMIYLSIHSASGSLKENIESNGSTVNPKLSLELKILLERYAKVLDYQFQDAVDLVSGFASGHKPVEVSSPDIIDWLNFTVFLNAWNLSSNEIKFPDGNVSSSSTSSTWNLIHILLQKFVQETVTSAGPISSSPGTNLPLLVQLITEPLSWHALVIQSRARSLLPSGKKKKKSGPSTEQQSNSQISQEIQNSIHSLCNTIDIVVQWLKQQLDQPEDRAIGTIFSSTQESGSGKVFKILESTASMTRDAAEVGPRILESLQGWSPAGVVRKVVGGQRSLLSDFLIICQLKMKSLQGLKVQM